MLDDSAVTALVGVAIGGLLSILSSLFLLRMQRRSQERYEVWTRLLNSYQDFANYVRNLISFQRDADPHLWEQALWSAHKATNDAATLDPYGEDRVRSMRDVLDMLRTREQFLTNDEVKRVEKEVDGIFDDFQSDSRLRFKRFA